MFEYVLAAVAFISAPPGTGRHRSFARTARAAWLALSPIPARSCPPGPGDHSKVLAVPRSEYLVCACKTSPVSLMNWLLHLKIFSSFTEV